MCIQTHVHVLTSPSLEPKFSRKTLSMPCFIVTVDDGHVPHAPCKWKPLVLYMRVFIHTYMPCFLVIADYMRVLRALHMKAVSAQLFLRINTYPYILMNKYACLNINIKLASQYKYRYQKSQRNQEKNICSCPCACETSVLWVPTNTKPPSEAPHWKSAHYVCP